MCRGLYMFVWSSGGKLRLLPVWGKSGRQTLFKDHSNNQLFGTSIEIIDEEFEFKSCILAAAMPYLSYIYIIEKALGTLFSKDQRVPGHHNGRGP